MDEKIKELTEQANELIQFGNSNEKAQGFAIIETIQYLFNKD